MDDICSCIVTLGDFRWYIIIECCCHFWTLEYGVSRLREHPEGPQSCQQDARRSSRRSSQNFVAMPVVC